MEKIVNWLIINWNPIFNLIISFLTAFITAVLTNKFTYKRTLKINSVEREKKQNMKNWLEVQSLIKDIANTCSYMAEIATAMSENKCFDYDKVYEYKKQVIDIRYELNNKLLMYMGVLKRIGINDTGDSVYYKFYQNVFDTADEIKKTIFRYLDSKGTENIHIEYSQDSELLSCVIWEAEHSYEKYFEEASLI